MSEPPAVTVDIDDPESLKDRDQLHAAAEAQAARAAALLARVPQVEAIYPKLVAGTATSREQQGVLAFVLAWMQLQESE